MIADGGIRFSGDISRRSRPVPMRSCSVDCLRVPRSPGETVLFRRSCKSYRGMGSLGAMQQGAADRYFQKPTPNIDKLVPEGSRGRVPYRAFGHRSDPPVDGGLRASMGYVGCANIDQMRTTAGIRRDYLGRHSRVACT